jgi:hypothetical protein
MCVSKRSWRSASMFYIVDYDRAWLIQRRTTKSFRIAAYGS